VQEPITDTSELSIACRAACFGHSPGPPMARIRCAEQYFQFYRAQSPDEAGNDDLRSQPYLLALACGPLTAPLRQSPVGRKRNFANGHRRRFSRFKSNKYSRRCLFDPREPAPRFAIAGRAGGAGRLLSKITRLCGRRGARQVLWRFPRAWVLRKCI
jgi:hypothetical protein